VPVFTNWNGESLALREWAHLSTQPALTGRWCWRGTWGWTVKTSRSSSLCFFEIRWGQNKLRFR